MYVGFNMKYVNKVGAPVVIQNLKFYGHLHVYSLISRRYIKVLIQYLSDIWIESFVLSGNETRMQLVFLTTHIYVNNAYLKELEVSIFNDEVNNDTIRYDSSFVHLIWY